MVLEKNHFNDTPEYVIFIGDYGELIYERSYHENALGYFKEAMDVSENILKEVSYDSTL